MLPDLSAFDVKTEVVHGLPVTLGYMGSTAAYGVAYIVGAPARVHVHLLEAGLQVKARRDIAVVVLAAGAFVVAVSLQIMRDRWYPRDDVEREQILYVRSGAALKRMALAFDALAADVYWIRAIQHYGGERLSGPKAQTKYELLYPLLDLTTTLDPYFKIAYRFGAIFLSEAYPGGPGRPDQAIALLAKGHRRSRTSGSITTTSRSSITGTCATTRQRRPGFSVPPRSRTRRTGSSRWPRPCCVHGNDRAAARFLWQQIAKSEEAWLRRTAERSLLQLGALDQIDQLEGAVKRFPPAAGEPYTWDDFLRRGAVRACPSIRSARPYVLDPVTGRVTVSPQSPLFPMPAAAGRLQ